MTGPGPSTAGPSVFSQAPWTAAFPASWRPRSTARRSSPSCARPMSRCSTGAPSPSWPDSASTPSISRAPITWESPRPSSPARPTDPAWDSGAIYGILTSYYAGMPDYLGGDMSKAEAAYARALDYSKGGTASLFVTYATSICEPKGDRAGFEASLKQALAVDPDARPDSRLETVLAQRDAKRLLADEGKLFEDAQEGD